MEPDVDDLHTFMREQAQASSGDAGSSARFAKHGSAEGRALELAIAAIEALCERGRLSAADLCRLAELHGYEKEALARAWHTRLEFDLDKRAYALDKPLARVLPLP